MSTPKMKKAKKEGSGGGSGNGGGNPAHELHLHQISSLRNYIESCPHVPSDCGAVRAALNGLDAELKRAERDEKLRKKFERERERAERERRERRMEEDDDEMDGDGDMIDDDEGEEGWQDVSNPTSPAALASTPSKPTAAATAPDNTEALRSSPELVLPSPSSDPHQDSPFGRELASAAVAAIAASGTRVATPLAAVALALHAAVTSELVGMRCTGVPDDDGSDDEDEGGSGKKKKSGGFAPPIRELPRNKFVPDGWDANAAQERKKQRVVLRYRKDGLGTTILRVSLLQKQQHEDDESEPIVRVRLTSSSTGGASAERGGPGGAELTFPIGRHINLDGLAAALAKAGGGVGKAGGGVCPSLHYIALPGLMTEFARTFDLGGVNDSAAAGAGAHTSAGVTTAGAAGGGGGSGAVPMDPSAPPTSRVVPPPIVPTVPPVGGVLGRSPQIDDLHPHPTRGDFAGDLAPGGIVDPRLGGQPGLGGGRGGSLMGPNHPAFRDGTYGGGFGDDDDVGDPGVGGGGYGDDPRMPYIGGTGMQPRFDPYYPPGIGPDPGRGNGGPGRGGGRGGGRGRGRGGRGGRGRAPPSGGDPNPDHQRPPADYGDHMFM